MKFPSVVHGCAFVAMGLAAALHFAGAGMKSFGISPGLPLLDLQAWLTTGGGAALIVGWIGKTVPQWNQIEEAADAALNVANIGRIKSSLVENVQDKATADALTTAGRAAFDRLKEDTFPLTSASATAK